MTENRDFTSAEHRKGSVKEALGKLTGDAGLEAEGRRQKRGAQAPKATGTERGKSNRD